MDIHIVGGFLGAGKTTAIIQSAKILMAQGKKVAVITNDQGRYLVDTAFTRLSEIPSVEITGGCFCCRYDDFEAVLVKLKDEIKPDCIFAESVGSCADVVVTVVQPLRSAIASAFADTEGKTDYSVFADSRLLLRRLEGKTLPFSEEVNYVYDRQIEEAGLLVLNKQDLLSPIEMEKLLDLAKQHLHQVELLPLSAKDASGSSQWLRRLDLGGKELRGAPLQDMDYKRYTEGELRLAWLDATLHISIPESKPYALRHSIETLFDKIRSAGIGIGHLKLLLESDKVPALKISAVAIEDDIPRIGPYSGSVTLTLNARLELGADTLKKIVVDSLETSLRTEGAELQWEHLEAFHPGIPKPQRGRTLE